MSTHNMFSWRHKRNTLYSFFFSLEKKKNALSGDMVLLVAFNVNRINFLSKHFKRVPIIYVVVFFFFLQAIYLDIGTP